MLLAGPSRGGSDVLEGPLLSQGQLALLAQEQPALLAVQEPDQVALVGRVQPSQLPLVAQVLGLQLLQQQALVAQAQSLTAVLVP